MHHYEVVFLIHPDQGEQAESMLTKYRSIIRKHKGKIHREENWGKRTLSYPIKRHTKAHYILMNVEVVYKAIEEMASGFTFNDFVLRHLIVRTDEVETTTSLMMEKIRRDNKKEAERAQYTKRSSNNAEAEKATTATAKVTDATDTAAATADKKDAVDSSSNEESKKN